MHNSYDHQIFKPRSVQNKGSVVLQMRSRKCCATDEIKEDVYSDWLHESYATAQFKMIPSRPYKEVRQMLPFHTPIHPMAALPAGMPP